MARNAELRSKLVDGVLAGSVLVLTELMVTLLITPIQLIFGTPGLLVYSLILLAVTVVCLERSLTLRDPDMVRAWWGIIGGLAAWVVVELNHSLGNQSLTGTTGMLSLLFVALLVNVIWRRIAPLGLRYFLVLFLLGWIGHAALALISFMNDLVNGMALVLPALGYTAAVVIVASLLYIFLRSQTRLDRLNAAITIWGAAMVMIFIFRGITF